MRTFGGEHFPSHERGVLGREGEEKRKAFKEALAGIGKKKLKSQGRGDMIKTSQERRGHKMALVVGTRRQDNINYGLVAAAVDDSPLINMAGAACVVEGYAVGNGTAAIAYVQLFDAALPADATLGSTVPRYIIFLPASGGANVTGLAWGFKLGCQIASTTTATGSTGAATDVCLWGQGLKLVKA